MRSARRVAIALVVLIVGSLAWAALAPIAPISREQKYEIPPGTSERRLAGEDLEILPHTIRLTLGRNDVLALKNADRPSGCHSRPHRPTALCAPRMPTAN
jgi:hypothetical protein